MDFEALTKRRIQAAPLALQAAARRLSQHRIQLTVVTGPDEGAHCDLLASHVSVGTAATNDLRLSDETVSRHHCEIIVRDDQYVVRDLGSTNGTYASGVRVCEAILEPGMRLALGDSEIVFSSSHTWVPVGESSADHFGDLFGSSSKMRSVFDLLDKVAAVSLTCLLVGETGTGKEVAARSIHRASARSAGPFVILDCGAVNENLIEAELFGHERGAYTGADRSRAGAFERAHGGTIFLDEIGELPLELQPKLLRVLERKEVTRLGAGDSIEVDVRVMAATHRDLGAMVERGTFREDLLYRLAEVVVRLPPLREHREDIALLAERILAETDGPARIIAPDALSHLQEQWWPGNVRELRNTVRRAAALTSSPVLGKELLLGLEQVRASSRPPDPKMSGQPAVVADHLPLRDAKRALEREYLIRLLARFGEDLDGASLHAGLHKKSLARLLKQHGLRA